ncbi:hypothetical protein M231_01343 [Tremella mesenterica]|uniref:Uncharacterized protein n=1 Tax=Tremella mesenterica TaxID=5217 RepID=A0A4V1M4T0_TREME|nr:hypothetical protein M231_01343 [Tremella mesenterica]
MLPRTVLFGVLVALVQAAPVPKTDAQLNARFYHNTPAHDGVECYRDGHRGIIEGTICVLGDLKVETRGVTYEPFLRENHPCWLQTEKGLIINNACVTTNIDTTTLNAADWEQDDTPCWTDHHIGLLLNGECHLITHVDADTGIKLKRKSQLLPDLIDQLNKMTGFITRSRKPKYPSEQGFHNLHGPVGAAGYKRSPVTYDNVQRKEYIRGRGLIGSTKYNDIFADATAIVKFDKASQHDGVVGDLVKIARRSHADDLLADTRTIVHLHDDQHPDLVDLNEATLVDVKNGHVLNQRSLLGLGGDRYHQEGAVIDLAAMADVKNRQKKGLLGIRRDLFGLGSTSDEHDGLVADVFGHVDFGEGSHHELLGGDSHSGAFDDDHSRLDVLAEVDAAAHLSSGTDHHGLLGLGSNDGHDGVVAHATALVNLGDDRSDGDSLNHGLNLLGSDTNVDHHHGVTATAGILAKLGGDSSHNGLLGLKRSLLGLGDTGDANNDVMAKLAAFINLDRSYGGFLGDRRSTLGLGNANDDDDSIVAKVTALVDLDHDHSHSSVFGLKRSLLGLGDKHTNDDIVADLMTDVGTDTNVDEENSDFHMFPTYPDHTLLDRDLSLNHVDADVKATVTSSKTFLGLGKVIRDLFSYPTADVNSKLLHPHKADNVDAHVKIARDLGSITRLAEQIEKSTENTVHQSGNPLTRDIHLNHVDTTSHINGKVNADVNAKVDKTTKVDTHVNLRLPREFGTTDHTVDLKDIDEVKFKTNAMTYPEFKGKIVEYNHHGLGKRNILALSSTEHHGLLTTDGYHRIEGQGGHKIEGLDGHKVVGEKHGHGKEIHV